MNTIDIRLRGYNLKSEDCFVEKVCRNGRYEITAISEIGYCKSLQSGAGLSE